MDISQALQEITMGELPHWKEPKPFKEIAKKEKIDSTEEKLPRWKKLYTPEEPCRIPTSEELCQMFTPEEPKPFKGIAKKEKVGSTEEKLPRGKKSYTPEELCRILTPEELCQMFTPEELLQMFTATELRVMFTLDGLRRMLTKDQLSMLRFPLEVGARERGRNGSPYHRNKEIFSELEEEALERGKKKSSC